MDVEWVRERGMMLKIASTHRDEQEIEPNSYSTGIG